MKCPAACLSAACFLHGGLERLYAVCMRASAALFCLLCLLVLYSIAARVLNLYGGGATDVAGYVMGAMTFLALAPTFRARGHIYVSVVLDALPAKARRVLETGSYAAMFAVASYLAFYLSRLAYFSHQFKERSEGADAILLWIPQLPAAAGAAVFAVSVLHTGILVFLRREKK
ncbi:MAG: TRAP transporter small permease [Gammaproteobacteria bacterium]